LLIYTSNSPGRRQKEEGPERGVGKKKNNYQLVLLERWVGLGQKAGDPKTLTPGPWTSPTDWVHRPPHGPVHGPPIRTTPTDPLKKFNKKNE